MSSNNGLGLLGTAIGFVILAKGVQLLTESTRHYYKSKGYKIHHMSKLNYHLNKGHKIINEKKTKHSSLIHQNKIHVPKINLKI